MGGGEERREQSGRRTAAAGLGVGGQAQSESLPQCVEGDAGCSRPWLHVHGADRHRITHKRAALADRKRVALEVSVKEVWAELKRWRKVCESGGTVRVECKKLRAAVNFGGCGAYISYILKSR